ncbi:MAG: DUF362 domain-containing protein [Deltaproteobacteria bacterium]|nr:DUF362 domain-containing protein [Deltaproteobacteria bacterium]
MKPLVSLVQYTGSPDSLKETIELCSGFEKLDKNAGVLIKPNLVTWDNQFTIAPFGVFTTTRLVEDLVIMLKDYGCRDISIGEGSVEFQKGTGTMDAYTGLGYYKLIKKYGIKLVDFNVSEPVIMNVQDGLTLHLAKEAVESDFLINFPVLKTHAQSKVSLGLKNLKGCLKTSSKKLCHHTNLGLEYCFTFVADCVKPALTIVDGIYALERGALHFGNAFRKEVIIASRDILAADMLAAKTIGFDPQDILHFVEYGKRHNKSLNLDDYELVGEALADHVKPLKWDWGWTKDNTGPSVFEKFGVTGIAVPKYDETLCSGCSPFANMVNILVLSAFKGQPLPSVEILNGKKMQARPGYDKTVLLGNCIIKANKENINIRKSIKVTGCPPNSEDVIAALRDAALDINETVYWDYLRQQGEKYDNQDGYSWDFYK